MTSIPASIPAGVELRRSAIDILAEIQAQPANATGVLQFGKRGAVLIESRAICWAVVESMPQRLTELLRHQRNPPIDRTYLQRLVNDCKSEGLPVGEALLASGHISEVGLRVALFRQTAEAIAHMARMELRSTRFVPHSSCGYDPRFRYSPLEILAALGARNERALAASAAAHLTRVLAKINGGSFGVQASGFACVAECSADPMLIASTRASTLDVHQALDLARWCLGAFDGSKDVTPTAEIVCGKSAAHSVVCWQEGPIRYVAACISPSASALLLHALLQDRRAL